jgi:hypothetical protein
MPGTMIQSFPKEREVSQGALFRRGMNGSLSEIAEVLDVGRDKMGIMHVRYFSHMMRGSYSARDSEERTLALDSFCARYKERIRFNEETRRVEPLQ